MVRGEGGGVLPSFLLFGVWIMRMLKVAIGLLSARGIRCFFLGVRFLLWGDSWKLEI